MHKYAEDAPNEVAMLTRQQAWAYGYEMGAKAALRAQAQQRAHAYADNWRADRDIVDMVRELSAEVSDDEG